MFDPELFGQAMGEAIRKAVEPLQDRINTLEKCIADMPTPKDGADGKDGVDGASVTLDDVRPMLDEAVKMFRADVVQVVETAVETMPQPKNGRDGADGKDGAPGEKGADGAGIADLMIDRDGALVATFTDGRMKSLGVIIGKDGRDGADGKDGADGISLESFEFEYLHDTHEICVKASAGGKTKELRYPAGGIRPGGYWRDGTKAQACEMWVHDGSSWIAKRSTSDKPSSQSDDWIIAARRGRDGERGQRGQDGAPPAPIKIKG